MQQRAKINSKTKIKNYVIGLNSRLYGTHKRRKKIIQNKEKNMENLWDMHNEKINTNVI